MHLAIFSACVVLVLVGMRFGESESNTVHPIIQAQRQRVLFQGEGIFLWKG